MPPTSDYRDIVREAITRRDGSPILNGSVDHAAIIIEEAFSSAKSSIRILSHKLDPVCYGRASVLNAVRFFLADPDHHAKILVEATLWDTADNYKWDHHPFIKELREYIGDSEHDQLQIRVVRKELASNYKFNFLLLDNYGYRLEADRSQSAAVAAFLPQDAEGKLANLENTFKQIWAASVPLYLPAPIAVAAHTSAQAAMTRTTTAN